MLSYFYSNSKNIEETITQLKEESSDSDFELLNNENIEVLEEHPIKEIIKEENIDNNEIKVEISDEVLAKLEDLKEPSVLKTEEDNISITVNESEIDNEIPIIRLNIPYISSKYTGIYKVLYNYYIQNSPKMYVGELVRGKRNGRGSLIYENEYKEGLFDNNEFVKGVYCNSQTNIKYIGNHNNNMLNDNNGSLSKYGFILNTKFVNDVPIINDSTTIDYDKNMIINFMGYQGKIIKHNLYSDKNRYYIESSITIEFKDCFIKTMELRTCLHSSYEFKDEYDLKFTNVVKIGNTHINDSFIYTTVNMVNNNLEISINYNSLILLFQTNNEIINNINLSDIEEWSNNKLILWSMITFPYFPVSFLENLKKYNIDGNEFKKLIDYTYNKNKLNPDLMKKLFINNNNNDFILGYINNSYDELTNIVYIYKIINEFSNYKGFGNNDILTISTSYTEFYKYITTEIPTMDENILYFLREYKINAKIFKQIDTKLLFNEFDNIRIFQILSKI